MVSSSASTSSPNRSSGTRRGSRPAPSPPETSRKPAATGPSLGGKWARTALVIAGRLLRFGVVGTFGLLAATLTGVQRFVTPRLAWLLVRTVRPMLPRLITHLVQTRQLDRLETLQATGISLAPAMRESIRLGDPKLVKELLKRDVEPDSEALKEALNLQTTRAEPIRSLLRHRVKPRATALDMSLSTGNDDLTGALLKRGVAPGPRALHWIPIRRIGSPMAPETWLRLINNIKPQYLTPAAFGHLAYVAPLPVLDLALQRTTHEKWECRHALFEAGVISDRPEIAQYALNLGERYDAEQCIKLLDARTPAKDHTRWGARLGRALELLAQTEHRLTVEQGLWMLDEVYIHERSLLRQHRASLDQLLERVVLPQDLPYLAARATELARAAEVGLKTADLAPHSPYRTNPAPSTDNSARGRPVAAEGPPSIANHHVNDAGPGFVLG